MRHENPARNKGTAQEPGESTTNTSDESAPFVCNYDDCVAVLPTEGARRSHEERDHNDEETEVAA